MTHSALFFFCFLFYVRVYKVRYDGARVDKRTLLFN